MSGTVLVTGGFGLVGSATVRRLTELGRTRRHRRPRHPRQPQGGGEAYPRVSRVRWADLTNADQTSRLVTEVAPEVIIHLAAIIPPLIYKTRALARRVNVDATATLVRIAESQPTPPRFVQASSNAVFGARNPHHATGPVTADMPMKHSDLYSAHKADAEAIVRASSLEWVVLRLGGSAQRGSQGHARSTPTPSYFESLSAHRRPDAQRRRPRRRLGIRRGDHGRRRAGDPADRRRRLPQAAVRATSHRRWPPRVGSRAAWRRAARATRTATTTGSSPTGWIPPARRKRCRSSTIRGRT